MKQTNLPFHIMAKPIGAQCNLRCAYCFYLEKAALYPGKEASRFRMTDKTLERYIKAVIDAWPSGYGEIAFAWQGGEPTLMGLPFFEKAVELQKKYAPVGVKITNAFQTNGVLLDDAFARFFHDEGFLVGISIDGPEALHNRYRHDMNGRGSFSDVMAAIERMNRFGVEYNLMTVIQKDNGAHPQELYLFLSGLGSPYIQFIPIVEPEAASADPGLSVMPDQWGKFLIGVFHEWKSNDIGKIFVQQFDVTLGLLMGEPSFICVHSDRCGRALALEHNGDVYSCDHFVDKGNFLGNISEKSLSSMIDSPFQKEFGRSKFTALPTVCRQCPYLRLCNGGCPKDRLTESQGGKLNWLCEGYKAYFQETKPYFAAMAQALQRRMPAREYVRFL